MKKTSESSPLPRGQFTVFVLLLTTLLVVLTGLLALIGLDTFFPGWWLQFQTAQAFSRQTEIIGVSFTPTLPGTTSTPFQPDPTRTTTSTPTITLTPTETATHTPQPSPTELPPPPPQPEAPFADSARIDNIYGANQALGLDCESRSAVDWANYFGVSIGEFEFLYALPTSDNPNLGFVGDPNGIGGQIPPYSYGVHAAPVARLLRAYGLPAEDLTGLSMEQLKQELSSGQPVIAWVIVGTSPGYAMDYTTVAGETVRVAPNEHTVIVIGYDSGGVTILDGGMIYWRSWEMFEASFGVLGNMAIIYQD